MVGTSRLRAVYKSIADQEIDSGVYLAPQGDRGRPLGQCPVLINIHGGAFMLGSSRMVNLDEVQDCLQRGWVVVAPNYRLFPQVDVIEGPVSDCRDLLARIHSGRLQRFIDEAAQLGYVVDLEHVLAFGTPSGGTLALSLVRDPKSDKTAASKSYSLSLGVGVPHTVAGIYNMYGPCNFVDPFWTTKLPHVAAKLPSGLTEEFIIKVFDEYPVPTTGGVPLERPALGPPDLSDPRLAFAMTQIANGKVLKAILPSGDWDAINPIRNISASFPPTFIVHGQDDTVVPIHLSHSLRKILRQMAYNVG